MNEGVNTTPIPPHVDARVRWNSAFGTKFGRVVSVDTDAGTLEVQIADSDVVCAVRIDEATLLSKPGG